MAYLSFKNCRIAGIAAGVPAHIEPTISTTNKYDAREFVETTGVQEKRYSEDYCTSDYCQAAAERLLDDLHWDRADIDALIFVSQTADYILPATSCVLHGKLGLKKSCLCQDISLGCSGWVYGVANAMALLDPQGGRLRKALVMAGDARKQAQEEPDQLFGYAGTVTAIEYFTPPENHNSLIMIELGSDGTGFDAIIRPSGGCRNQFTSHSLDLVECDDGRKRHALQERMKGMDVFSFGITTVPKSIKNLGKEFGFDYMDYDYFILHQANRKMLETIRRKLKISEEKMPYSITRFGNTSSASIPLTMVTELGGKLAGRHKIMACGFGVGLSWGSIAFETNDIVLSKLVELK